MEGPKVNLVVFNCGEHPMIGCGKLQGEIYCHEVTRISRKGATLVCNAIQ